MLRVQDVVTDALWIVGLAGLLATFSYMSWYRSRQGWSWRYLFSLPRLLVPFCVSLELFCIGLAVNGAVAYQPAPWWETAAWSILAVIFALQTVIYGWVGIRRGWDTPIDERVDHERSRRNQ
ncbi:MAG: hypothetical protein U0350_06810 [Caldilineaceae bacterium]